MHCRPIAAAIALALGVGALVLTGCAASTSASAGAGQAGGGAVPAPQAPEDANAPQDPSTGDGRLIARTAAVTIVADDVRTAAQSLRDVASNLDGWVTNESVVVPADESQSSYATIQLTVPSDKLDAALTKIGAVGRVTDQSIQSEDVTDRVIDTDSRIATMRASIARLQQLMTQTASVADIAAVEAELTKREADLESLLALQKSLSQRVDTATIDVTVVTKAPPSNGFVSAMRDGWSALRDAAHYLVIVVGALLPWLLLAAVIAVPILVIRRRRQAAQPLRVPLMAPAPSTIPAPEALPLPTVEPTPVAPAGRRRSKARATAQSESQIKPA